MCTDSKWFRILLFGSIYFIEGAILTYFSGFSAVYLRSHGISFTRIGIAGGIAMLPFILKIFMSVMTELYHHAIDFRNLRSVSSPGDRISAYSGVTHLQNHGNRACGLSGLQDGQ